MGTVCPKAEMQTRIKKEKEKPDNQKKDPRQICMELEKSYEMDYE